MRLVKCLVSLLLDTVDWQNFRAEMDDLLSGDVSFSPILFRVAKAHLFSSRMTTRTGGIDKAIFPFSELLSYPTNALLIEAA